MRSLSRTAQTLFVSAFVLIVPPAPALAEQVLQSTQNIQNNTDPSSSQSNPQSGASQLLQPAESNGLQVAGDKLVVSTEELAGDANTPATGWRRHWNVVAPGLIIVIVGCISLLAYRLRPASN